MSLITAQLFTAQLQFLANTDKNARHDILNDSNIYGLECTFKIEGPA